MKISEKEKAILRMLTLQDKQIAQELYISLSTVKTYVHNILNKLSVDSRQKALIKALKLGVVTLNDIEVNDAQ